MKILNPNTGKNRVPILINHVYVSISDYGTKLLLKEIKINIGQHTWYWIEMKERLPIDISGINDSYCTFNNAINRSVNNPYCTVYEFDSYDDMIRGWEDIKYIANIETMYEGKEII